MTSLLIQRVTAEHFGVGLQQLRHSAVTPCTLARRIALFLAREQLHQSYPEIGRSFEVNHTTAMDAWNWVKANTTDPKVAKHLATLRARLGARAAITQTSKTKVFCESCGQSLLNIRERKAVYDDMQAQLSVLQEQIAAMKKAGL